MQFSVTPREALGLEDLPLLNSLGFDYNAPHVVYPPAGSTNVLAVCVFGTGTRPDQSSIYLRHLHELTGLPTIGHCNSLFLAQRKWAGLIHLHAPYVERVRVAW